MKNHRIKILRIQSRICIGGPAIHTELLSRFLPSQKYKTILLGGALEPNESSKFLQIKNNGVDIRIVRSMRREPNIWRDLYAIFDIYKIIKTERPDIVHTHTAKAGTVGRIAAWLAGVPVIIHTFHGHTFENYFGQIKSKLFIFIERLLATLTDQIIAISPSQKADLAEKFKIAPGGKITIIRLGFELDRFLSINKNGGLKRKLSIPDDRFVLGIIGRMVPIKNHLMALKVLRNLLDQNVKAHLCIVGGGTETARIKGWVRDMALDSNVSFLGWIEEIEQIYAGIDALLLTSLNEGTPVALIEAMASSVPVIATKVGGVVDVLTHGETGLLCKTNDSNQMADYVKKLIIEKSFANALSINAKKAVIGNYSYSRLIGEMDNLYQTLLKNKNQ